MDNCHWLLNIGYWRIGPMAIGLLGLILFAGCTSDPEMEPEVKQQVEETGTEWGMGACTTRFTEVMTESGGTRAGEDPVEPSWAPTGFFEYKDMQGGEMLMSNERAAICAYLVQDNPTVIEKHKVWKGYDDIWRIDQVPAASPEGVPYFHYGYVPLDAASSSIAPYDDDTSDSDPASYAKGAILTLNDLSSVSSKDVSVVVGAKEGNSPSTFADGRVLRQGDFDTKIYAGQNTANYLFVLFDHIYASLNFTFRVDAQYNALRTIKMKKLELTAYTDNNFTTRMKKTLRTTITLQHTTDGSSPIVGDVIFTPNEESGYMDPVLIFDSEDDPIVLDEDPSSYIGFVPKSVMYYKLRATYDVFDKKGNLIRRDATAENKLNIKTLFNRDVLRRGYRYTINVTIIPTYLYMMSEPDLENPVIRVQ